MNDSKWMREYFFLFFCSQIFSNICFDIDSISNYVFKVLNQVFDIITSIDLHWENNIKKKLKMSKANLWRFK